MGSNIDQDSVRYWNDIILSWQRMLAENELEKLQARKAIFGNLTDYSNISDVSTWQEDLEGSFLVANDYSLDDFMSSANLDITGNDNSLWDDADFEPMFIGFSGGGSIYTNTLNK